MNKLLILLSTAPERFQEALSLLKAGHFEMKTASSLSELAALCRKHPCRAVMIDLDTAAVDNESLKRFSRHVPDPLLLAVSGRRFHEDLQEAMQHCIYACLRYPIDPDELMIVLKGISAEER
ncbi:MAG: hypothetical protein K9L59_00895 [Desulfobacterales bacterium]|nr:hypothetical protein [Desulfobacterales bacterium]MCF8078081.1 hypothetical protein [Desulfobacterales bacterium]